MPVLRMLLWRLFNMTSNLHPLSTFPDVYTYIYCIYTYIQGSNCHCEQLDALQSTSNRIIPYCWFCQNPTPTEALLLKILSNKLQQHGWMAIPTICESIWISFSPTFLEKKTTPFKGVDFMTSCVGEFSSWIRAFSRYRYGIGIFACDTNAIYSSQAMELAPGVLTRRVSSNSVKVALGVSRSGPGGGPLLMETTRVPSTHKKGLLPMWGILELIGHFSGKVTEQRENCPWEDWKVCFFNFLEGMIPGGCPLPCFFLRCLVHGHVRWFQVLPRTSTGENHPILHRHLNGRAGWFLYDSYRGQKGLEGGSCDLSSHQNGSPVFFWLDKKTNEFLGVGVTLRILMWKLVLLGAFVVPHSFFNGKDVTSDFFLWGTLHLGALSFEKIWFDWTYAVTSKTKTRFKLMSGRGSIGQPRKQGCLVSSQTSIPRTDVGEK